MTLTADTTNILDSVDQGLTGQLETGRTSAALEELFDYLLYRRSEGGSAWADEASALLSHPLRTALHQDPFTFRAFAKPRGYAGDAVMMDYIYGLGEAAAAEAHATPLGREIFRYMGTRPSAKAVRFRRRLIASMIDRAASRGETRVLALASGHLREVELSNAAIDRRLAEFTAFDQDGRSLEVVSRDYARFGVQPMQGSVRHILSGKAALGEYDLVYAAGLFDYLTQPVARALTQRMFSMTRPGGTLLIPNFARDIRDAGYMESFMDWHLIYRDTAEMLDLAAALPGQSVEHRRCFSDPYGAVVYLSITKSL